MSVRSKVALFFVVLISTTSCATQPQTSADDERLAAESADAMNAYLDCMHIASQVLSLTPVSSVEAGIAAQGECTVEFTSFELATRKHFSGIVTGAEMKLWAMDRADRKVDQIKRKAQETVVAEVIEYRVKRGAAKQQPQAPKQVPAPVTEL